MKKIILASNSPRRKELLEQMNLLFEICTTNVEENASLDLGIEEYVKELAYIKAKSTFDITTNDRIVIGADTVVWYNNKIMGKPKNDENAFKMLKDIQGNICEVYTGLCVIVSEEKDEKVYKDVSSAKVVISQMSDKEIYEYISTGEPMDKAGAFAIQGIGAKYIKKIDGDYYAVVGLPINNLYNIMKLI